MARKAILAYCADRANDDGSSVYCSKVTISEEVECSKQTVIDTLRDFVAEGLMIEAGTRKCGNGYTVEYDMCVEAIAALPVSDQGVQNQTPRGPKLDGSKIGRVKPVDPMGSSQLTQTVLEPSLPREGDAPASAPSEKKHRLPPDWTLSDEGWSYARSQKIPDEVIADEASGFHAYWSDRNDRDARKSLRGWEQCWAGWCRRIAGRYRNGRMAGAQSAGGRGPGGSLASIAAWRRATGAV